MTATAASTPRENVDFLPLTVDYVEKTFAAGKIPGGFFKREGRPSEVATLTSRFIDRPIRPLFPEGYNYETQIIATVLSVDQINDPDNLAIIGASAALVISDIPFIKPLAGCRVGRIDGKYVINAVDADMDAGDIDVTVAASENAVVMVEGGGAEVSEKDMVDAIAFAHEAIKPVIQIQKDLQAKVGKPKREVTLPEVDEAITQKVNSYEDKVAQAMQIKVKADRYQTLGEITR